MLKGTQRRLAVLVMAITALSPLALLARPASAFPPGDSVSPFSDQMLAATHLAALGQTVSPPAGTFKGGIDTVTGQLQGGMKLPATTFTDQLAGLAKATAVFEQIKPVTGHMNLSNNQVTATVTFLIHMLSAYASNAPQPPVNLVGKSCTAGPIKMTLRGIAHSGAPSKFTGKFKIPKFTSCGSATSGLNSSMSGSGNTFTAVATPTSSKLTLPTLPVTLPTIPVTLPTLPVTLPTIPVTLPTLPVTLPSTGGS